LVTSTANMSTGVTTKHLLTVRAWTPGQHPTTSDCCMTQKESASFSTHRWNVGTYPDLAFASFSQDSRLPDRRVRGKFPRSQHRHSLITPPRLKVPAHSDPVKCWNFRKADWKRFCLLTGESVERLPSPDTLNIERAYQDFCENLLSAAKGCIPRGRRKNYVPTSSAKPSIASSSEPQWGLTLVDPLLPLPTISAGTEAAGPMGGSCQFHRFLAL